MRKTTQLSSESCARPGCSKGSSVRRRRMADRILPSPGSVQH